MTVLSVLRPSAVFKKCLSGSVINGTRSTTESAVNNVNTFRLLTTSKFRSFDSRWRRMMVLISFVLIGLVRNGGGHQRVMEIIPSKYQWHKYKDLLHFYLMLGAIPALGLVFYTNVFIGPATLTEIPCDYQPRHWEYEKARYFSNIIRWSLQLQLGFTKKYCISNYLYLDNHSTQFHDS